jgi:hypothetical protein
MKHWLPFRRAAPRSIGHGATAMHVHAVPLPPVEAAPAANLAPHTSTGVAFLAWLLDCPSMDGGAAPTLAEADALRHVDALSAGATLPPALLSRAAAVIPQLLHLLRQADASLPAIAQRVSADPVLAAEVLRLSSNAFYRTQGVATDIEQAIAMLGRDGLQMAIATVVLKPLFHARSGSLSCRAAPRLWEHSTIKARQCAVLAAERGENCFEGYLAGLLHNTGWTVLLRGLDSRHAAEPPFSAWFADHLVRRKNTLFAKAVQAWHVTPTLDALCHEVLHAGLAGTAHPLAALLLQADDAATQAQLAPHADRGVADLAH